MIIALVVVPMSIGRAQDLDFRKSTFVPTFADSGQNLGDDRTFGLAVGDIDGDGDVDLVVSNYQSSSRVWKNDGHGVFIDSGQSLGSYSSHGVALGDFDNDGDLDSDGDLDALVNQIDQANPIWFNDGDGFFSPFVRYFGQGFHVTLGDLENDGDLDAFTVHQLSGTFVVVNDGTGVFDSAGPLPGSGEGGLSITLGDVDRDRDLDLFIGMNDGFGGNRLYVCTIPRETVRTPSGRVSPLP